MRVDLYGRFKIQGITEKVIGAAMKVHSKLGNGFPGAIYQRAMQIQLQEDKVIFKQECNMTIFITVLK